MRTVPVVVALETVALIVVGLLWLLDGNSMRPDVADGAAGIADHEAAAARRAGVASDAGARSGTPASDAPPRLAVGDQVPEDGVVVHGRITTADGSPVPEEVSVSFRRGRTFRSGTQVGDRYAVAALAPGTWSVRAAADAFTVLEYEHELGGEAVQTLDLELRPAHVVTVYITDLEGAPLLRSDAVKDLGLLWGLHVVATEAPLIGDLPPTDSASVGDIGIGRFRNAHGVPGPSRADEADGELWLDRPPPANAAVLLRHVVLAQAPIAPGQHELRFTIGADLLRSKFGTVKLRLVDGATGQPIAGVRVGLSTAQGGGAGAKTNESGEVTVDRVMPGLLALEIWSGEGRESWWDEVRVAAGQVVDLGDISLHPTLEVQGRVLQPDGTAAQAYVQWTDLGTMDHPRELVDRRSFRVDAEGAFKMQLGPRRFVFIARGEEDRIGYAVVDARSGPPPAPVEIRLATAGAIIVTAPEGHLDGFVATLRDQDGVPIAARRLEPRFPSQTLTAPPGRYVLEVHGMDDRLVLREEIDLAAGQTRTVEVR